MPNPNLTEFFFIVDRSGSMRGDKEREVISGFNGFMQDQANEPGEARVSVVIFDGQEPFKIIAERSPLDFALNSRNYQPRGMTPLYKACMDGIDYLGEKLANEQEEQRPGKVVFVIMTDGLENASRPRNVYNKRALAEKIRHQETNYSWNFIFLGQDIDAEAEGAKAGFKQGTTSSVGSFEKGLQVTSAKVRSYRSSGNAEQLVYTSDDKQAMS